MSTTGHRDLLLAEEIRTLVHDRIGKMVERGFILKQSSAPVRGAGPLECFFDRDYSCGCVRGLLRRSEEFDGPLEISPDVLVEIEIGFEGWLDEPSGSKNMKLYMLGKEICETYSVPLRSSEK